MAFSGAPLLPAAGLPAFPGAEGFGSTTPGGRGGRVIEVNTLAGEGPGSLHAAVAASGPRTIVFRVGGTITLKRNLLVNEPFVTIAGQTAPGDGICIRGAGLVVQTHDVVIRHLRFRVGDAQEGPNPENRDSLGVAYSKIPPYNIVFDHCSISWAIDENLQLWYPCHDITIQWCLISESLHRSIHPKGPHGMGLLVGDRARRISIHHTLFAHNNGRNPLLKGGTQTEVVNNVIYNWGSGGTGLTDLEKSGPIDAHIIANHYLPGPQSGNRRGIVLARAHMTEGSRIHVSGNRGPGEAESGADDWPMVDGERRWRANETVFAPSGITVDPAAELPGKVLEEAGAILPRRDAVDTRVVASVRDRAGAIIDSTDAVGGWPTYRGGEAPLDTDHDGMPDEWERTHGLDPTDPADGSRDADGDGYRNLEEFLNSLRP